MKVGLFGIRGVYNFGCEAIVRGTHRFVQDVFPECDIIYYTYSEEYDRRTLTDLNITIKPICENKSLLKRIVNKIYRVLKVNKQCLTFDFKQIINEVDVIVSIGGDIYTIPQILRERKRYPYYNPLIDFCNKAIRKGKNVIVYGASVGPWGDYRKAVDYNVKALSKYKLILCREEETISYLNSVGLNNTMFFPDPAFQIRSNGVSEKQYIGINLSPLSLVELYGSRDEIYIEKLSRIMDRIYEELKIQLMFIPHVLSNSLLDNDLEFLKEIYEKMYHKDKVVFADASSGFVGLKKDISKCYVVVASRMHCAVNAIDENVPAIFLAYSQKAVGMCKYVYGNNNYLLNFNEVENDLISRIKNVLKETDELSKRLEKRNEDIYLYYENHIDHVSNLVNNQL